MNHIEISGEIANYKINPMTYELTITLKIESGELYVLAQDIVALTLLHYRGAILGANLIVNGTLKVNQTRICIEASNLEITQGKSWVSEKGVSI